MKPTVEQRKELSEAIVKSVDMPAVMPSEIVLVNMVATMIEAMHIEKCRDMKTFGNELAKYVYPEGCE